VLSRLVRTPVFGRSFCSEHGTGRVVVGRAVSGRVVCRRCADRCSRHAPGKCRYRPQREDHGRRCGGEDDSSHLAPSAPARAIDAV